MSDASKPPGPTGKIEFIEYHRPVLPSGDYEIKVTQTIKAAKQTLAANTSQKITPEQQNAVLVEKTFESQTRKFSIQGPRFTLEPQAIRAVFPPAGSLGEHSSVLPHISFNRSTLPWERFAIPLAQMESDALEKRAEDRNETEKRLADTPKLKTPWLALLLFDQDEAVEKKLADGDKLKVVEAQLTSGKVSGPKACTLLRKGDFWTLVASPQASDPEELLSPEFPYESGQQDGDPVTVVDVDRDLLEAILPSMEDVQLLGHVRQPTDDLRTPTGDQVATLLANRLPKAGHMSVVHLVSLEGMYGPEKNDIWSLPEGTSFVRLVSLKSWRFTCLAEEHSFKGLLHGLGRSPSTLRLSSDGLNSAAPFVKRGCVPMPHEMRQGNRSVSWYHGPLAPGFVEPCEGSLPARSADQLVRYNPGNGMFDVSYAAAWELGRLLTLQNDKVAVSLLDWKRRHRAGQEMQRAMQELEHLPIVGRPVLPDLPADATRWFEDLALLKGVPFNYLVPDERMLPQESIRFFWIDPDWIRCLHDGAFNIGRVLPSDHQRDAAHHQNLLAKPQAIVTGFLLRSEVVAGWPDLQVDGYDEAVAHENYEHDTRPPQSPINASISLDPELQKAMNNGDASNLASQFGVGEVSSITVSPIVADSRWLVNVNENETLYLVEKITDGLRLSIENKLPLLRMERLSPNVLICMFAGDIKTVDIHQKPEALHFGMNRTVDNPPQYYREMKDRKGGETKSKVDTGEVPWKGEKSRVLKIADLASAIASKLPAGTFTSAHFAFQMTEGVQKVRFVGPEALDPQDWTEG